MSKQKYFYNPKTLQYEKVKSTTRSKVTATAKFGSAVMFCSTILYGIAQYYLPTPKERALQRDLTNMRMYVEDIQNQINEATAKIDQIQEKDAQVHRVVFGMDPIDEAIWEGGIGGRDRVDNLVADDDIDNQLQAAMDKLDKLKRKVNLQEESLDTLINVADARENRLASIPSIKPVREDKLKRKVHHLSGYGMRIHPVHKVRKMHYGIDFTSPEGTKIQATGNGVIKKVVRKNTGYGLSVTIDHGYGYETLYAHMSATNVKVGQRIKKGEVIGEVGSTGTSTAPHLHYEVRVNGKPVNPIDYVLDGLSPEEYKDLVDRSNVENQSLD